MRACVCCARCRSSLFCCCRFAHAHLEPPLISAFRRKVRRDSRLGCARELRRRAVATATAAAAAAAARQRVGCGGGGGERNLGGCVERRGGDGGRRRRLVRGRAARARRRPAGNERRRKRGRLADRAAVRGEGESRNGGLHKELSSFDKTRSDWHVLWWFAAKRAGLVLGIALPLLVALRWPAAVLAAPRTSGRPLLLSGVNDADSVCNVAPSVDASYLDCG